MTTAASRRSDRRISPVFVGIVAVMAVTGWATWTGFAEQPGLAVFLFVTSAWIVSRSARQRSTGPFNPNASAARTPRSNATHTITFEYVKCRGSPRTSQMP